VTINVYVPGKASCQTIDHVWVDTGSVGLRLFASAFTATLPLVQPSGTAVGNCSQFVSAYTWGAMRSADVKIGGESAASVPIQIIGDSAVPGTAPTTCSTGHTALGTAQAMGANGLLGIGVFRQDCGGGCVSLSPTGYYYTCPSGTCSPTTMPLAQQLQNVVSLFSTDNNGILVQLPALTANGAATASGSLIFGINTQTNNALDMTAVVFPVDPATGYVSTTTTYGSTSNPSSYVDSGSNGWFFDDPTIAVCSTGSSGFYCPGMTISRSATLEGYQMAPSFTYSFSIADANSLSATFAAFNNLGGPSRAGTFDWGLPFFYGRSVYTALESTTIGATIGGHTVPFIAATTP
jgi:hypothetical protein